MTYLLRVLLLAFTILSLMAARWAYVRGQPRQARFAPAAPVPSLAFSAGPQWLPGANWCSWSAPGLSQANTQLVASPVAATSL